MPQIVKGFLFDDGSCGYCHGKGCHVCNFTTMESEAEQAEPDRYTNRVQVDSVRRYFSIDVNAGRNNHDDVLNVLLDEPNAKEAISGHTGFLMCVENDSRLDAEIIDSLVGRLKPILPELDVTDTDMPPQEAQRDGDLLKAVLAASRKLVAEVKHHQCEWNGFAVRDAIRELEQLCGTPLDP